MNDFYGRLFHSLPGLACVIDSSNFKLCDANSNFSEKFKINRCSLSQLSIHDIITDPKDRSHLLFVMKNSDDRTYCELDEMNSGLENGNDWLVLLLVIIIFLFQVIDGQ